jgi:hypothetical protein
MFLQAWVFSNVCFYTFVFAKSHFSTILFVGCQIHFGKVFFFLYNGYYSNERSSISCCDGWFGLWNQGCCIWSKVAH